MTAGTGPHEGARRPAGADGGAGGPARSGSTEGTGPGDRLGRGDGTPRRDQARSDHRTGQGDAPGRSGRAGRSGRSGQAGQAARGSGSPPSAQAHRSDRTRPRDRTPQRTPTPASTTFPTLQPEHGVVTDPARAFALAAEGRAPLAEGTDVVETICGGRPAVCVRPGSGGRRGRLLYLHGGGYRAGSPRVGQGVASYLAAGLDVEVVLPAYRLAGERPFPAAVEDALAAYADLLAGGTASGRIAVLGDSAGGGLAAAALLAARDAGLPRPAALLGLSPWYDLTVTAGAYERCRATDTVLSRESMRESAARYLAGADPRDPLASPLFAGDAALGWLPPVLLQSSTDEVLTDDAVRFADRVNAVGGRARHRAWAGQGHCWHLAVPGLPAARQAVEEMVTFLSEHLI